MEILQALPSDPFTYVIIYFALILFGISKSGFGGGLGALSVLLILQVLSVYQTIGLLLPILCLMDIFSMIAYKRNFDVKNLKLLGVPCLVGIIVGSFLIDSLDKELIKLMIGILALLFTLDYFVSSSFKRQKRDFKHSKLQAGIWGSLAGFSSMIAHSGGPPANFYLLPQKMDKKIFVGTTVYLFAIINYTKLIPYIQLNIIGIESLMFSLIVLPTAPIGIYLGIYLQKKFTSYYFYLLCYGALFLTGLKLLYEGLTHYI